ncbi:IS1634 family transposase [Mycoplasmopsis caviae]|uniref:Transposase n=1 Tax=Mycoplasmopsis caviae TaxID=55603 RepID=A0A3P8K8Y4_9BACT|nr:IS1634 family transposase [Mycoplasmopsis caviae]VDR41849.1 Transposase [Mycoplasmopsis caviae]
MKKDLVITDCSNGKQKYCYVIRPKGYNKGADRIVSLGNVNELSKIRKDYKEIFKRALLENTFKDKNDIKTFLLNKLKNIKNTEQNTGSEVIYTLLKKLEVFDAISGSKHKNLEAVFNYQVASKMLRDNYSIKHSFENKDEYTNDVTTKIDTFYSLLDVLCTNKDSIIKTLNKNCRKFITRNEKLMFYDSTTVYFETFEKDGLRMKGYSKENKVNEDQVVFSMATDSYGVPFSYNLFPGNTIDSKTLKPYINDLSRVKDLSNVTIVADRGMSTKENLSFLESHNINFIMSYRLKSSTNEFKDFAINKEDMTKTYDGIWYKEYKFQSDNLDKNGNKKWRKRVITYSEKRAKKDRKDREKLIDNFKKQAKGRDFVTEDELNNKYKKYRYFEKVAIEDNANNEQKIIADKIRDNKVEHIYKLDYEKILEDEKYDGLYVYETTLIDMPIDNIVETYKQQYLIEDNFRILKSTLKVRPIYVYTDNHIRGHFVLSYIALFIATFIKKLLYQENINQYGLIETASCQKIIECLNNAKECIKYANETILCREKIEASTDELYTRILNIINNLKAKKCY